jgi:serine/threonine-protein kinase HipA
MRCPITYDEIAQKRYSLRGLHMLARNLTQLQSLPFTAEEQRHEAARRAGKMSIQGVQPKLSARLNVKEGAFEIVDAKGTYILKPQSATYPELPQNEDLTMRLAAMGGIEVPLHGMVYSKDDSLTYFIRRFDRAGRRGKLAIEDFAQLQQMTRETKYNSSMERVAATVAQYCTFPAVENVKLFRLTLFSFLVGNEDMHLKNFSLIQRDGKVELAPAYDLINTTIAIGGAQEELALPLNGKKRNLTRNDLVDYFGVERLGLNKKTITKVLNEVRLVVHECGKWVEMSFLSDNVKSSYSNVVIERAARLAL